MTSLLPCGYPFQGDQTLPETLVSQLLASWAPQRGLLELPEHEQCLGHKLCGSCTGRAWPLPPSLSSENSAGWAQDGIACSANGQAPGSPCFRAELAVMLLKAGWFLWLCASMGNKHNWTLDFRMNVWCPSPKKSSVALHHPTVRLVWAYCRGHCLCSLRWISVMDTYCNSHAWIPLGNISNIQALGRGDFAKHTHCSQRGSCVSPATGAGRGSAVLQISCPPCRTKGRPSQTAWQSACWCQLSHGMTRGEVWPCNFLRIYET